jgi:hypothetical protein
MSEKRNFKQSFKRSAIISAVTTFIAYMIITRVNWGLLGLELGGGPKPDAAIEEAARAAAVTETIRVGDKTWMKRNLNVWTRNSWCHNNDNNPDNCAKYGRKYTWLAAKRACASLGDGWRLPKTADWNALGGEGAALVAGITYKDSSDGTQYTIDNEWWTATGSQGDGYFIRVGIDFELEKYVDRFRVEITRKYCVRCVKD